MSEKEIKETVSGDINKLTEKVLLKRKKNSIGKD